MKKVSIILPVKNAAEWLQETLDSIAGQTHSNWELISIDDGSTDLSLHVLEQFEERFKEKTIVLQNTSKGIIPALQLALKASSGEYITRIDADDIMPTDRLSQMIKGMGETDRLIVTGKVSYFSDGPISEGYLRYQDWINERIEKKDHFKHIYRECVIASPNWLARRKDLIDHSIFENLSYPEDYHITFNWYRKNFTIAPINITTLQWREHPKRTSRNSEHYQQKAFFKLKINQFINNELKPEDHLGIIGANTKTNLITSILDANNIPYMIYIQGKSNTNLISIDELRLARSNKLLIAVYPDEKLKEIESYLENIGFIIGSNAWYI